MADKKESVFGKYIVLYLSKVQAGPCKGPGKQPGLDIFRPFRFILYILARIWSGIFEGRR